MIQESINYVHSYEKLISIYVDSDGIFFKGAWSVLSAKQNLSCFK